MTGTQQRRLTTRPLSRRSLFQLAGAGGAAAVLLPSHASTAAIPGGTARPLTIPALAQWQPSGNARFHPCKSTRVVVAPRTGGALLEDASLLASELRRATGLPVTVARSERRLPGEVRLDLHAGYQELGSEGYRLRVDADGVAITANAPAGVFYGTRTLLQLLRQGPVPAGTARDWPRYPERGLMVDMGNTFFSAAWLRSRIEELADLKMNYLHLHLSDDGGFRIASDSHPEIVAKEHLTKAELRQLVELAAQRHITVVPEIDMPGHLTAALAAHPELRLRDVSGQPSASQLDITNPAALRFARQLVDEYAPLFPGPYWHIGGDEYMPDEKYDLYPALAADAQRRYGPGANGKDALVGFLNTMSGVVRAHGKTARVWADDLDGGNVLKANPSMIAEWWDDLAVLSDPTAPGPNQLMSEGHRIMNCSWFPTYYNTGQTGQLFPRPDMRDGYEHWSCDQFAGAFFSPAVEGTAVHKPPERVSPTERRNLGAKVHIWSAGGGTEQEIAEGVYPFLRVVAQKSWDTPLLTASYAEYETVMRRVGRPGPSATAGVLTSDCR